MAEPQLLEGIIESAGQQYKIQYYFDSNSGHNEVYRQPAKSDLGKRFICAQLLSPGNYVSGKQVLTNGVELDFGCGTEALVVKASRDNAVDVPEGITPKASYCCGKPMQPVIPKQVAGSD
jgi:hypothetical protein